MDDSIVTTPTARRTIVIDPDDASTPCPQIPAVPEEARTPLTWKVILLEAQSRLKIIQNKAMITISILNLCSLALILACFFGISWILIDETDQYNYWASLVEMEKICKSATPPGQTPALCNEEGQVVYSITLWSLFSNVCQVNALSADDPTDLCSMIKIYRITGVLASIGIWLGMLLHLFCIFQFFGLASPKRREQVNHVIFKRSLITTTVFYVLSWVGWMAVSVNTTANNTHTWFVGRLGLSFYLYFVGIIVFILLAYWYKRKMGANVKMDMVNDLLESENRYSRECSVIDISEVAL